MSDTHFHMLNNAVCQLVDAQGGPAVAGVHNVHNQVDTYMLHSCPARMAQLFRFSQSPLTIPLASFKQVNQRYLETGFMAYADADQLLASGLQHIIQVFVPMVLIVKS